MKNMQNDLGEIRDSIIKKWKLCKLTISFSFIIFILLDIYKIFMVETSCILLAGTGILILLIFLTAYTYKQIYIKQIDYIYQKRDEILSTEEKGVCSDFSKEYGEVGNNIRTYADMRFKQLTLLMAITGAILLAFDKFPQFKFVISLLGIAITLIILGMEISSTTFWHSYFARAMKIEDELNLYGQYKFINTIIKDKEFGIPVRIRATINIFWFYSGLLILWILTHLLVY